MKIKDKHKKAILGFSSQNKRRLFELVDKLEGLGEITPKGQPFSIPLFAIAHDIEGKMLFEMLQEWKIVKAIYSQKYYKHFIFASLPKLREIKNILIESLYPEIKDAKVVEIEKLPPKNWQLREDEDKAYIKKDGRVIFSFPHKWALKCKYFKYLWSKYGEKVKFEELYEFDSNLKYPQKGVWQINRNIRNTINKLRKEFGDLPILIKTNKGFVLTIY